jgi:hypothetical protein
MMMEYDDISWRFTTSRSYTTKSVYELQVIGKRPDGFEVEQIPEEQGRAKMQILYAATSTMESTIFR